jgi:uncharacterized iron-regulated protein
MTTAIASAALLSGCATRYEFRQSPVAGAATAIEANESHPEPDARSLRMFAARQGGVPIDWRQLLAAAEWADVVFIGEEHDDALAHDVQLAIVEDLLAGCPRGSVALSMEMLERDDQPLADDYLAGLMEQDEFIEQTGSAGWPDWIGNYQPIIDAAKAAGSPVIAANAPRRYVRLARTKGYEFLRRLTPAQRDLFTLPRGRPSDLYRVRFIEVMTHPDHAEPHEEREPSAAAAGEHAATSLAQHQSGDTAALDAAFRSQLVWDATMGQSIARGLRRPGVGKVVHLVGQFHSDFDGGTVQMLRAFSSPIVPPRVLTISLQRRDLARASMDRDDLHRADIVIYTGARPPEEEEESEEDAGEAIEAPE